MRSIPTRRILSSFLGLLTLLLSPTLPASLQTEGYWPTTHWGRLYIPDAACQDDNQSQENCGAIPGAQVNGSVFPGVEGGTVTDAEGHYALTFTHPPCPGGDVVYANYLRPVFYFQNFNPRSPYGLGRYSRTLWFDTYCFSSHEYLKNSGNLVGLGSYLAADSILDSGATPNNRLDIRIDMLALSGQAFVANDALTLEEMQAINRLLDDKEATLPEEAVVVVSDDDKTRHIGTGDGGGNTRSAGAESQPECVAPDPLDLDPTTTPDESGWDDRRIVTDTDGDDLLDGDDPNIDGVPSEEDAFPQESQHRRRLRR